MAFHTRIWSTFQTQSSSIFRRMFNSDNKKLISINEKPRTIIVEGNIGAGKTTFLKPFLNHPDIIDVIPEPVEKWRHTKGGHNLLEMFYQNPERNSLLLQTYVQLTMVRNHTNPCPKPLRIMERSLARYCFVENLYRSGTLSEPEYLVLSEWFDYLTSAPQMDFHVDEIIYLRTSPEVVYERIRNRHRHEEMKMPLKYLRDLHELHEEWLVRRTKLSPNTIVTIIDANGNLDQLENKYEAEKTRILNGYLINDLNSRQNIFQ